MLASGEGDDMANWNLGPGMDCWVVLLKPYLFFVGKHEIGITENGGSKWEQWPLETTLYFEHSRFNVVLLQMHQAL